ncbi:class I SAM-dependent methyltransferase [Wukongibacter baidiensis]|uniref:tRNA (adenine(22)-N(1))-methyltransferase n=1 Tax=Wukongibacter baidiensis TaxID=1723361 RepID=UPI003D7F794C
MKLTQRLKTIADLVPNGGTIADIGTDHAYLPVYLIENKIVERAIAADINVGPLKNAERTIKSYSYDKHIETRLGSGLTPLKANEVDTVIIAGMGGLLIRDILKESIDVVRTVKTLILQPMVAQDELRKWLCENGFKIDNERLAKEGNKLYEILVVTKGKMEIENDIYYEIGDKLIENEDPYLSDFIEAKLRKYTGILKTVENENTEKAKEKFLECKERIEKLKEVKSCL